MLQKKYRVTFLLAILVGVIWLAVTDRTPAPPDWDEALKVVIYPHNADGSDAAERFIAEQKPEDFEPITDFFTEQAARYELPIARPFELLMGPPLASAPRSPPRSGNFLERLRWGLSIRWWQFRFRDHDNNPDIIVIAHHFAPENRPSMPCPVAIDEYRLVIANLVAGEPDCQGLVIIAHEILHTVGASDLHDLYTLIPRFPEGYAEPDREPRYPQTHAELMAPRIPIAPYSEKEAHSFDEVVIGQTTAREIGWIREN